nr:MAG TPA: hypothetical protein [Caudoviricetes sp.]
MFIEQIKCRPKDGICVGLTDLPTLLVSYTGVSPGYEVYYKSRFLTQWGAARSRPTSPSRLQK